METFKGKAIYNPTGKAGEYAEWGCNFYVGCTHGCTYCYLKKGRSAKYMGGTFPTLKKCFRDEAHARQVFEAELKQYAEALRKTGLFFSFTTDPMLKETKDLTLYAVDLCLCYGVPVKILTKNVSNTLACFLGTTKQKDAPQRIYEIHRHRIAIGFTLTGHSEMEPNAATNSERVDAMRKLHAAGFKTFASVEPVIDFETARHVIRTTIDSCDLYKIGLLSGQRFNEAEAQNFVEWLRDLPAAPKIYLKERLQKLTGFIPESDKGKHMKPWVNPIILPENFVGHDYNLFDNTEKPE